MICMPVRQIILHLALFPAESKAAVKPGARWYIEELYICHLYVYTHIYMLNITIFRRVMTYIFIYHMTPVIEKLEFSVFFLA